MIVTQCVQVVVWVFCAGVLHIVQQLISELNYAKLVSMITMTFIPSKKRGQDLSHCASAIRKLEIIVSIATSLVAYL